MLITHSSKHKKKHYGHHVCPMHDLLSEELKFPFPKICDKCFSTIKGLHYNILAWNSIRGHYHDIQIADINQTLNTMNPIIEELHECISQMRQELEKAIQTIEIQVTKTST